MFKPKGPTELSAHMKERMKVHEERRKKREQTVIRSLAEGDDHSPLKSLNSMQEDIDKERMYTPKPK